MRPRSVGDRFAAFVRRTDLCWLWLGSHDRYGYGLFWINGRTALAHRIAWELSDGPIPEGLHILHRCNQPACVRVDHLYLGTHTDNMRDRSALERQPRKLTYMQVAAAREAYQRGGVTYKELAHSCGVTTATMRLAVTGRTWRHEKRLASIYNTGTETKE